MSKQFAIVAVVAALCLAFAGCGSDGPNLQPELEKLTEQVGKQTEKLDELETDLETERKEATETQEELQEQLEEAQEETKAERQQRLDAEQREAEARQREAPGEAAGGGGTARGRAGAGGQSTGARTAGYFGRYSFSSGDGPSQFHGTARGSGFRSHQGQADVWGSKNRQHGEVGIPLRQGDGHVRQDPHDRGLHRPRIEPQAAGSLR